MITVTSHVPEEPVPATNGTDVHSLLRFFRPYSSQMTDQLLVGLHDPHQLSIDPRWSGSGSGRSISVGLKAAGQPLLD